MVKLMGMCDKLDEPPSRTLTFVKALEDKKSNTHPLLVGIVPGIISWIEYKLPILDFKKIPNRYLYLKYLKVI